MSEATPPTAPAGLCNYQTDESCPIDMSHALIMEFVRALEEEAARHAGTLNVAALRALADTFLERHRSTAQPPKFCLSLHNALMWDERRRHPFERLLVKRFAHLLPARSGDDGVHDGAVLSRRLIPGLMTAIVTMIGFDAYHQAEEMTRTLVDRERAAGALPVNWEHIAHAPEIELLMDRMLATVAGYFAQFDKRVQWLVSVVNSHLGPRPPEDGSMVWAMGERKAVALLSALYKDLRHRLRDDPAGLEAEVGRQGFAALLALHASLNTAEERIGLAAA